MQAPKRDHAPKRLRMQGEPKAADPPQIRTKGSRAARATSDPITPPAGPACPAHARPCSPRAPCARRPARTRCRRAPGAAPHSPAWRWRFLDLQALEPAKLVYPYGFHAISVAHGASLCQQEGVGVACLPEGPRRQTVRTRCGGESRMHRPRRVDNFAHPGPYF